MRKKEIELLERLIELKIKIKDLEKLLLECEATKPELANEVNAMWHEREEELQKIRQELENE